MQSTALYGCIACARKLVRPAYLRCLIPIIVLSPAHCGAVLLLHLQRHVIKFDPQTMLDVHHYQLWVLMAKGIGQVVPICADHTYTYQQHACSNDMQCLNGNSRHCDRYCSLQSFRAYHDQISPAWLQAGIGHQRTQAPTMRVSCARSVSRSGSSAGCPPRVACTRIAGIATPRRTGWASLVLLAVWALLAAAAGSTQLAASTRGPLAATTLKV